MYKFLYKHKLFIPNMKEGQLEEYLREKIARDYNKLHQIMDMSLSYTMGKKTKERSDHDLLLKGYLHVVAIDTCILLYNKLYPNNPDMRELEKEMKEHLDTIHDQTLDMLAG